MIVYQMEQRSMAWFAIHRDKPTASGFDKIMTPGGKATSNKARDAYLHGLLAGWLGVEQEPFESQWMNRGRYLEDEAVAYYEVQRDLTSDPVGFVTTDDGSIGCSPDRLIYAVGDNTTPIGGLEIKCPSPAVHMGYVIDPGGASGTYSHQVQGCLWVTGLAWWDVLSYHPQLPPALVRVAPCKDWQRKFAPLMQAFLEDMEAGRSRLIDMGYTP